MASHSHYLLSCTKHRVGVLRALKKCFVHLSSKMTFSAKKAQTHENLSQVFLEAQRSDFVHLSSKMTFLQKSSNA